MEGARTILTIQCCQMTSNCQVIMSLDRNRVVEGMPISFKNSHFQGRQGGYIERIKSFPNNLRTLPTFLPT